MTDSDDTGAVIGVDGYERLELVGRGASGSVYRAWQDRFQRTVAIKVLDVNPDVRTLHRFEQECRTLGALSGHPNIVALHDAGQTKQGRPYLVMAYLPDGSLANRLERDGTLSVEETLAVGIKLAGALETAHAAGVLHRDVKPENVLRSPYGEPQLADFGLARFHSMAASTTSTHAVTPAHAAPEVLGGQPATAASDIWSLGSSLFTLLWGAPPFVRDTDEVMAPMFVRVASEPPPNLRSRNIPDQVASALEHTMEKDPARRPASARAVGEALQAAQADLGLVRTPIPVVGPGSVGPPSVPLPPPAELAADRMRPPPSSPAPVPPLPPPPPAPRQGDHLPPPPQPEPRRKRSKGRVIFFGIMVLALAAAATAIVIQSNSSKKSATSATTFVTNTPVTTGGGTALTTKPPVIVAVAPAWLADLSPSGQPDATGPVSVAGKDLTHAVGIDAANSTPKHLDYSIGTRYAMFTADLAVGDKYGGGPAHLDVLGDGTSLLSGGVDVTLTSGIMHVSASVTGVHTLTLVVSTSYSGYLEGVFGNARLSPPAGAVTPTTTPSATPAGSPAWLTDLSPSGQPAAAGALTVGGKDLTHAVGLDAANSSPTHIDYTLGGRYTTLRVDLAIGDKYGGGAAHIDILGDGSSLLSGGVDLSSTSGIRHESVSLVGVQTLTLVVTTAHSGYVEAVFGNAQVAP
jgi:serine/threonine protein kinase